VGFITFFNLPEWMKGTIFNSLNQGKPLHIWGEWREGEVIQPQLVHKVGGIEPVYPSLPVPLRQFKKLVSEWVTPARLSPLPDPIASILYHAHFPEKPEDCEPNRLEYGYKWAEIFLYLYKLRQRLKKFPAPTSNRSPDPFISSLPFKLTGDQLRVIGEIYRDLQSPFQKRRVVIGDVGSGKTIVMLATAYMAEKCGIMCPTSILAEQIYGEALKYLTPLGLKVALVTQKSNPTDGQIREANLVVGTHALLYRKLPPLNAIVVDEQHRFGVAQRKKLEELVSSYPLRPHHFQFSATPIPRTQALIQSNFIEVSLIKELPFKRDIETRILPKNREGVLELVLHLQREIGRGKQAIVVYPAVDQESQTASLERGRKFWEKYFPGVMITHGRDRRKEEVLREFRERGSLLVTTTIIEVGISLPRLSTIAIVGAEQFGLATLHQLRGRVGRYGEKGFCFLITDKPESERLRLFAETLDGFKIAELDLKFRRAGDLLEGNQQSGKSFKYFDEATDSAILEEVQKYLDSLPSYPPLGFKKGEEFKKGLN
jgi:ATP-dependent DNA helicase RecG